MKKKAKKTSEETYGKRFSHHLWKNIFFLHVNFHNMLVKGDKINSYELKWVFFRQATTRLICSLLSLPVPFGNARWAKEDQTTFSGRPVGKYLEPGKVHKLLLLGLEGSGTSTIFKQVFSIFNSVILLFVYLQLIFLLVLGIRDQSYNHRS